MLNVCQLYRSLKKCTLCHAEGPAPFHNPFITGFWAHLVIQLFVDSEELTL